MGRGWWARCLESGAIAHRAPALACTRRRWALQDVVAAGAAQLIDGEIGRGQHPGGATIVPIQEQQGALWEQREHRAQLGSPYRHGGAAK